MIATVSPSTILGTLKAPPSKSCMQRACAAALINNGTTIIDSAGNSNDEKAAKNIVQKLGGIVDEIGNEIMITSSDNIFSPSQKNTNSIISVGESGLSLRMFVPVAALLHHEITFTGEGSILKRPVHFFDEILPELGVEVKSNEGKIPLRIHGPLIPKNIIVDGSLSSQFLTGLLMAYAKAATTPVSIQVNNLASKPYIDLTLDILKHFGFQIENNNYELFTVLPAEKNKDHSIKYTVEGDWSNIAFLLVAGALAGEVKIKNADIKSCQGDKKVIDALKACGAKVIIDDKEIIVSKDNLTAFEFDATHCPDLFPPLVALASNCKGTTTIKGVNRLLHKESDRAKTLQTEFAKMNVKINLDVDVMEIEGSQQITGAKVTSHNDHRIAMSCAVAALVAKGDTTIYEADAVKKSYPGFFYDMKSIKAAVQIS